MSRNANGWESKNERWRKWGRVKVEHEIVHSRLQQHEEDNDKAKTSHSFDGCERDGEES